MGYIAKLTKGARSLNLNNSPYKIDLGFVPPSPQVEPLLSYGTAANRDGASKRGETPRSRSLNFGVTVSGSSEAQCRLSAQPMIALLNAAGDEDEPLYFEFKPNDDIDVEPLWGQYGANLKYEITHLNNIQIWPQYGNADVRSNTVKYNISCTIKPTALGKRQRLASAVGGVLEDTIGTLDGRSRGPQIPEGITNKMTNPVFGHGTWNNGWTTGSDLSATENTDPQFKIYPDRKDSTSAKIVRVGGTNIRFYQSIDVGNTNAHTLSCYAKKQDGSAITSSDLVLLYGSNQTTTYKYVGNGWYRLIAGVTGVASATNTGVNVSRSDLTVYVTGFQMEERNGRATPLAWGALMGCAWSGTAHASTSTRTAARMRIPIDDTTFNRAYGTIRVVWRATHSSATLISLSLEPVIFLIDTITFQLKWNSTSEVWQFSDGASSINSSTQSFDIGDILIFHVTWGPDSRVIYLNGTSIGSGASFAPFTTGSYIYIGSDATPANHNNGTYLDFSIFDRPLTAAQALVDATNISAYASGPQDLGTQISPTPWLWTLDGDDIVDNGEDGTDEAHIICSGIPGNMPAKMRWVMTINSDFSDATGDTIYLSLLDLPQNLYFDPDGNTFDAFSGTVSITSAGLSAVQSISPTRDDVDIIYEGREFYRFDVFTDAGSNLLISSYAQHGGGNAYWSEQQSVNASSSLKISPPLSFSKSPTVTGASSRPVLTAIGLQRTTGSANITRIWGRVMFRPLMGIKSLEDVAATAKLFIENGKAAATDDGIFEANAVIFGDTVELLPDRFNMVSNMQGGSSSSFYNTQTMTYNEVYVTPRWLLI